MKKITTIILLLFFSMQFAFAQGNKITGVVTSAEDGSSLPGVTILVKGTQIGIVTDMDGRYELDAPQNAEVLVFSFVGFATQEIILSGQRIINVTLELSATSLDEFVVVVLIFVTFGDVKSSSIIVNSKSLSVKSDKL